MTEPRVQAGELERFCAEVLRAAGADTPSADAASRAMLHASIHGVDSHGVRLLPHYDMVLRGGRVNGSPQMAFDETRSGSGMLDADHGHGALAAYTATRHAAELAAKGGIGAVGIRRSTHFGAAGAYALAMAEAGYLGLVFCNSDSFVRLHDGAARFHGTNPVAVAAPSGGQDPWLLDMATSAVPYNRVQLYRSTGQRLPDHTASRADGTDTSQPDEVEMLAPLGGEVGFKGAGLGGMVEIFSALLTGMNIGPEILPMGGPDVSTPRDMGAFVLCLDPDAFVGAEVFKVGMARYLDALRSSPAREGGRIMAPGDREWAEAHRRRVRGIPLDPQTAREFQRLASGAGIAPPFEDIARKQAQTKGGESR